MPHKLLALALCLAISLVARAQCPIILSFSNQDLVGCEGDNFIFGIQFDDEDQASIEWTLPDGTTTDELSFGYAFESPDGCNDVQTIGYKVVCSDGVVLEDDSLTVSVFTYNEATVEIEDCVYTVMPDCPDDVQIIGGNDGGGVYVAAPGDMGFVPFEISNPGAPDECNINSFNYNYNCFLTGIEDPFEDVTINRVDHQLIIRNPGTEKTLQSIEVYNLSGQRIWYRENTMLVQGINCFPFQLKQIPYAIRLIDEFAVSSKMLF